MNKIPKSLTEWSITKVLELLIPVLGGTLLAALPILFREQIAPLLSQTQWSVLSSSLLAILLFVLWKALKYRHQIYSKKRPIKILLKKLKRQHSLYSQIENDRLTYWLNTTEPLFKQPALEEFKKDFILFADRLRAPDMFGYHKDSCERIPLLMARAIEHLKCKLGIL